MGAIFGFFFFIIILVLVLGLSIVRGVLRFLFGTGSKSNQRSNRFEEEEEENTSDEASQPKRKKVFDKEDGEYVEFEEVKEDPKGSSK